MTDALTLAAHYAADGWPDEDAAERCGVDVADLRAFRRQGTASARAEAAPAVVADPAPVVAGVDRGDPNDDDVFWAARPVLGRLRDFARARRAAPWAVLGVTLARVIAATPPLVVLPPLVGGCASLNLFVALVGPSGAGKGAAERAAGDAVDVGPLTTAGVGSGEGIAHLFARRVRLAADGKPGIERLATSVLMVVPEIDILTALGARKGATLTPELRRAWSGEELGFAYADPDKRLPIVAHSYRLAMVVGVQPGRAEALLGDADGGTPQRFLWLPATDPHAPDRPPKEPLGLSWRQPTWPAARHHGMSVMPVCRSATDAVDAARLARLRGENDDALDGHLLLARLKTAAALGLLEGRAEVTDEDWQLAGIVAAVSRRTREAIGAELAHVGRERNRQRGEAEGERAVIAADRVADATEKRIARGLMRKLCAADGWVTRADLRRALPGRDRPYFESAMERLLGAGGVDAEPAGVDGRRYRATAGKAA